MPQDQQTSAPDFSDIDSFVQKSQPAAKTSSSDFDDIDSFVADQAKGAPASAVAPPPNLPPAAGAHVDMQPQSLRDTFLLRPEERTGTHMVAAPDTVEDNPQARVGKLIPDAANAPLAWLQKNYVEPHGSYVSTAGHVIGELGRDMLGYGSDQEIAALPGGKTALGVARGVGNVVGQTALDPLNWPFLGMSEAAPMFQRALTAGMALSSSAQTVEAVTALRDNWGKLSPEDRAKYATETGISGLLTLSLAKHTINPKVGAAISPSEVVLRAGINPPGIGEVAGELRIPRRAPVEPAANLEDPTIPNAPSAWDMAKGNLNPRAPLPPAEQPTDDPMAQAASAINQHTANEQQAERMVRGIPEPAPPAPPVPPPPPKLHEITPDMIYGVARNIARYVPPEQRAQAITEMHGIMSQQLLQQGKVVGPDGKIEIIKNQNDADRVVQKWINDEVDRQDKAAEETAKQPKESKPAPAPNPIEEAKAIPPEQFTDVDKFVEKHATVEPEATPERKTGRDAFDRGDRVKLEDGRTGTIIFASPKDPIVRIQLDNGGKVAKGISNVTRLESVSDAASAGGNSSGGREIGRVTENPASNHQSRTSETAKPESPAVASADNPAVPKYKFGNTQAPIAEGSEAHLALESARARISPEDLHGKGTDVGGNHVTVRYGIKGDDTAKIKEFLRQQAPFEASLGRTESFPPSEHSDGAAVIQAPIEASELHRLNSEIAQHGDFTEPSFPEYKPHATIAYVKPEKAERYTGMKVTEGKKFTVDRIAIADRNGNHDIVKLEGKKKETPNVPESAPKGANVTSDEFVKRFQSDRDGYVKRYLDNNTENGVVSISADRARSLFPEYAASKEGALEHTETTNRAASMIASSAFDRSIASGAVKGKQVAFIAGGPGSGKSTAENAVAEEEDNTAMLYEGNLSDPALLQSRVKSVLDAGGEPTVFYVYAPPKTAMERQVSRSNEIGRYVTIDYGSKVAANTPASIEALFDKYGDKVQYRAIDNSGKPGEGKVEEGIDAIRRLAQNRTSDEIRDEQHEHAKHLLAAGTLSQKLYDKIKPRGEGGSTRPENAGEHQKVAKGPLGHLSEEERKRKILGLPPSPGKVGEMRVSVLRVAPHRFQYKLSTDAEGVGTLLKETRVFNPDLAGIISVWRDPSDGKTYVINGHHRFELARRTRQKDVTVRHIVAKDATEARAIGALQNIAEGRGTAIDAAKYFRDTGITPEDLKTKGISLGEATARDGIALSRLAPEIFQRLVAGDLRIGRAKAIGEATADHSEQAAILSLVEKRERTGGKVSDDTLAELIRLVKGAEKTTETTADLFGSQEITRSLALEKAEISAYIKQQLGKDKRLFGFVSKGGRATELERGGNRIDVDRSGRIATDAAQAEEVYDKLSERGGQISSILDESARRLADGDNAATVKSDAYQRVREEVSKTLGGTEGASPRRSEGTAETPAANHPDDSIDLFESDLGPITSTAARTIAFTRVEPSAELPSYLRVNQQAIDVVSKILGVRFIGVNLDRPSVQTISGALYRAADNARSIEDQAAESRLRSFASALDKALDDHPKEGVNLVRAGKDELKTAHEELLHSAQRKAGNGSLPAGVPWKQTLSEPGMAHMAAERIIPQLRRSGIAPHPSVIVAEGLVDILRGDAAEDLSPIEAFKTAEKYFEAALQQHGIEHLQDFQAVQDYIAEREEALNVAHNREEYAVRSAGEAALSRVLSRAAGRKPEPGGTGLQAAPDQGQGVSGTGSSETGGVPPDNAGTGREGSPPETKKPLFSTQPIGLSDEELAEWSRSKGFRYEPAGEQLGMFGENDSLLRVFRNGPRGREQRGLIYQSQLDSLQSKQAEVPAEPFALISGEFPEEQPRLFGAGEMGEIIGSPKSESIKLPSQNESKLGLFSDESGELNLSALSDAAQSFYKADIEPSIRKTGKTASQIARGAVAALYPRIEASNPIGRALGIAAPADAVDALMKVQGDRTKNLAEFRLMLQSVEKFFDRLPDKARVDFIDRMQTGKKQPNEEMEKIAGMFRDVMEGQRQAEEEAVNMGRPKAKQVTLSRKENYFHNWWDVRPGGESQDDELSRISRMFTPRRPLEGTKGYNKQQKYTLSSGIEAGGKPVTTNPVRVLEHRIEDGMKWVTARRAWHELKQLDLRVYVGAGQRNPEGFDDVNDKIAKVYFPVELEGGKTAVIPGGRWAVEANTARLLNNMLSVDKVRGSALGRGLMWLKNASTAIELGVSPFHAVFESVEAMSSQMALGLQRAYNQGVRQGKPEQLGQGLKEILSSPLAPITMAREGSALPAYIEARARLGKIGLTQFGHVIAGEQPHGVIEAIRQFRDLRRERSVELLLKRYPDLDQLVDDMFQGGLVVGQHRDYQTRSMDKTFTEALHSGNPIGAALRVLPALTQGLMHPLFNVYIPALKYSLFLRMMSEQVSERSRELEQGTVTRETLARQVADSVENRFGELNFDNLFLDRSVKSGLQLLFRSVTWKMGTAREMLGGIGGQSRELARWAGDVLGGIGGGGNDGGKGTDGEAEPSEEPENGKGRANGEKALPRLDIRASWVASLIITTAIIGAVAAKLLSGKYPWQHAEEDSDEGLTAEQAGWLETVHPRTGETDSRGKPVRLSLPTYWKEVENITSSPKKWLTGSLSTILGRGIDVAENRDYFGNYVYDPNASLLQELKETGKYVAPTPFVVSNFERGKQQGLGKTAWLSAFGFPKAPSDLDFTPAERLARSLSPHDPATPEELEQWRAKRESLESGEASIKEERKWIQQQRYTWLQRQVKRMTYSDAMRVYDAANDREAAELSKIIATKRANALKAGKTTEVEMAEEPQ